MEFLTTLGAMVATVVALGLSIVGVVLLSMWLGARFIKWK